MYVLTTLHKLRQYIGLDSADTSEDQRLVDALSAATSTIEYYTSRQFQPQLKTLKHTINPQHLQTCLLREDLLTLNAISTTDGTAINLENVSVVDGYLLEFISTYTLDTQFNITGIWGYHPNWDSAWSDSGDTIQNTTLSATETALEVNSVDTGLSPRFQVGQLLRINDEYLTITALDTDTNTLTIRRGVNGTIASTHSNNTSIEIYNAPYNIQQMTLRWALWYYREPDAILNELPAVLVSELADIRRITVSS